jgi:hypothetical protein
MMDTLAFVSGIAGGVTLTIVMVAWVIGVDWRS